MSILVVGVGSILCGDDAIGVRVVDELEKLSLPEDIIIHSADISGLDLLKLFPDHEKIIVVDAADMGLTPGEVKVFDFTEIKKAKFDDSYSTHGMALLETLTLAQSLDLASNVTIVGVQPKNTGFSLYMSEEVKTQIPKIVNIVKDLVMEEK